VNGFTDHLYSRLVTTSNYSATANLHNSQIISVPTRPFPACCGFIIRSLTTAYNSGDSSASRPQLISSQPPVQNSLTTQSQSSKLCYDLRSAGQSILEQSTHLGLTTRSWLLSDSCGFVDLGRPLWREDGSAVCNCYWPLPAQSFSGPSPVGFVAIFYCLRFETSLFVASYDSQGHGGGIRPRLHTGFSNNWLCPLLIKSRHGLHRKHISSIAAFVYVALLRICCLAMERVYRTAA
jgi:hypothetical protein